MEAGASQILVTTTAFRLGDSLQRLTSFDLAGEHLHQLLAARADAPPIPHQANGPEQIPLDHQRVKPPDALLRVDPVQHQVVLDRGAQLVRHEASALEPPTSGRGDFPPQMRGPRASE